MGAASLMQRSRHRLITALAAYDDSGAWALTGAHTCAQWVADRLGVHAGTAREWLRVRHALARLPRVDAAVADGSLPYGAARALTRVALDHPDHEHELLQLADGTRPADLSKALAAWAMGHDTDEQLAQRERNQTWFSARVEADGMGTIHVRLPAIDMGRIQAAVDARVMQSCPLRSDREPAPDRSGYRPSLGAQRAHALVELLTGPGPVVRPAALPCPSPPR